MDGLPDGFKPIASPGTPTNGRSPPPGFQPITAPQQSGQDQLSQTVQGMPAAVASVIAPIVPGLGESFVLGHPKLETAQRGFAVGVERPIAGIAQTLASGLQKVGILTPGIVQGLTNAQNKLEGAAGVGKTPEATAGAVLGEALFDAVGGIEGAEAAAPVFKTLIKGVRFMPELLANATAAGSLAGTEFSPENENLSTRAGKAFDSALATVPLSVGGAVLARGTTKLANGQFIKGFINGIRDFTKGYAETNDVLPKLVQTKVSEITAQRGRLYEARNTLGDRLFPQVDVSDVKKSLNSVLDEANTRFGKSLPAVKNAIEDALNVLSPEQSGITIKGQKIDPNTPVGKQILGALSKQYGGSVPVTYSTLDRAYLDLQTHEVKLPGEARNLVTQALKTIKRKMETLERKSPGLRSAAARAERYFKAADLPTRTDQLEMILNAEGPASNAPTFVQANRRVVGIFTGTESNPPDQIMAQRLWNTMGSQAKDVARRAVINELMMRSTTEQGGIDPARITRLFEDMPTKDMLFPEGTTWRKAYDGLSKVVSSGAKTLGAVSRTPKNYHALGFETAGFRALLRGYPHAAIADVVAAFGMSRMLGMISRVTGSPVGLHWLAASSRIAEDTPEWGRITNMLFRRFAAPVGASSFAQQNVGQPIAETGAATGELVGDVFGSLLQR